MMKRTAIPIALLVLGAIAPEVAQAEIEKDFPQVVVFGRSSVDIGQNSTVHSGDLVANQAGGIMSLGNKVTTPVGWEVKADILGVGNFVNLNGAEFCNAPSGGVVCSPLSPLPVYGALPIFQTGSAGGSAVTVANSGSTTLSPGDYGALSVGLEGTVIFAGPGEFNFTSFHAGRKGQFVFTGGPVEIRVSGDLDTGVEDNINLAASPVAAADVVFYVGGNASMGDKTTINASIYAQGQLELGSNVLATGAFLANQVIVGQKSQLTLATFWDYQPCQTEAPGACDDSATTLEDQAVTIDVLANDTDFEGDPLFVNSVTQAANGTVTFTAGDVTYSPDADYFGDDSFTYEVCDEDTQINADNCASFDVTVSVTSVNDPPVAAADSATMAEDSGTITVDVLANDTAGPDNELQDLTLSGISGAGNGHAAISGGQVEYTPDPDFFGTDSIDYTVCDSGDGADDDTPLCSVGTLTITVTPVNDPPVANATSASTTGDVNLPITLTGSDVDGDSLTFTIIASPTEGLLLGAPTQLTPTSASVVYDPATALDKPDQFTFQVDDGNGGTDAAFVSINPFEGCTVNADCLPGFVCNTVTGVCEPEESTDIQAQDAEFETATGTAVAVVVSASAPAAIGDLAFSIYSGPGTGSLTPLTPIDPGDPLLPIRSASATYTPTCIPTEPASAPVCSDSFVFQACEIAVPTNCDTATVTIQVSELGSATPPVALDQSVFTSTDTSVTINLVSPENTSGDPQGRSCTQQSDCASGFTCVDGSCVDQ